MNRKLVLAMVLAIVLVGMLTLTFKIQPVESDWTWTETVYIRADGSVEPITAPVSSVDNVTYTLTDNIVGDVPDYTSAIEVERDNIVVDGAGYTLQGTGRGTGITLSHRYNVTLKNLEVRNFDNGIYLSYSSNSTITSSNASLNDVYGIYLSRSGNNTIASNTVSDNARGIFLYISSSNVLTGNNASSHKLDAGIMLQLSNNNTITGNTVSENNWGIHLSSSSNNVIYHNNFINNTFPVAGSGNVNKWDDGYPSGGNYWSDYEERYPNATEIDGTGIWDTPYVIDENNQDNYPVVPEFASFLIPPVFTITTVLTVTICRRKDSM